MLSIHTNTIEEKNVIRSELQGKGIKVSACGQISYCNTSRIPLLPDALYLLRHAETDATVSHAFMSDNSPNAHINSIGERSIARLDKLFDTYDFDVILICSDIPRVIETGELIKRRHPHYEYVYRNSFRGIDNGGWEYLSPSTLDQQDYRDYFAREYEHNVFARSSNGGSWGDVLVNASKLIDYLNNSFGSKRVLLVSQGSILRAIKIIIRSFETPWEGYDSNTLFNHGASMAKSNYGTIECIFDRRSQDGKDRGCSWPISSAS